MTRQFQYIRIRRLLLEDSNRMRGRDATHPGLSQSGSRRPRATLQEKLRGCGHPRPHSPFSPFL